MTSKTKKYYFQNSVSTDTEVVISTAKARIK